MPRKRKLHTPTLEEPLESKSGNYGFAKLNLGPESEKLPAADTTWTVTLTVPEGAMLQYALFMVIHSMEQHIPPEHVEDVGGGVKRLNLDAVTDPETRMAAAMLTLANDTLNTVLEEVMAMMIRATPDGAMVISAVDLAKGQKPS